MVTRRAIALVLAGVALILATQLAGASSLDGLAPGAMTPVSAFARPAFWLDPSRLSVSTEVSVGSSWGGRGTEALQVTRLSYQLGAPLAMRVSLGDQWGPGGAGSGSMFLEGLDVAYRPFQSFEVRVRYQDLRSPLQLTPGYYWR